jgi:hypothetical protein
MPGFAERLARKARQAGEALKSEYEAGKRGDTAVAEPIWATPKQQLDAILGWLGGAKATKSTATGAATDRPGPSRDESPHTDQQPDPLANTEPTESTEPTDAELDEIATQLGGVDWSAVRSSVGERSGEAADAVRAMAAKVDWDKVQPVAAQVSSALITAVAAGRLPIAGRLGPIVAQAIAGQSAIGQRLAARTALPTDLRRVIDATSSSAETRAAEPPAVGTP